MHRRLPKGKTANVRLRFVERIGGNALPLLITIYTRPIAFTGTLRVKKLKIKGKYSLKVGGGGDPVFWRSLGNGVCLVSCLDQGGVMRHIPFLSDRRFGGRHTVAETGVY